MPILRLVVTCALMLNSSGAFAAERWQGLYEPEMFDGTPVRVMKPLDFDPTKRYPVIVSLHGAGGKGTNNSSQLKDWNRQLAEQHRRRDHPCYVVAPQAEDLWNKDHLAKVQALLWRKQNHRRLIPPLQPTRLRPRLAILDLGTMLGGRILLDDV